MAVHSQEYVMEKKDKIILVTGVTGHQGGAVASHLLKEGWKVRGLTRHPQSKEALSLKNAGVEIFEGDFEDIASLDRACKDVYGIFSVQQPLEYGIESEIKQGKAVVDAALRANVRHLVYSSYAGAEEQPGVPFIDSKWEIEQYIRKSGLNWTIFRPVLFMEYFLMPEIKQQLQNGYLRMALDSEMPIQLISVEDIGAMVTLAFDNPDLYAGKALDIAGDEITGNQIADIFSKVTGKAVSFEQMEVDDVRAKGSDFAMFFEWLNRKGFSVDIEAVKKLYPEICSFKTWVQKFNWSETSS
jgi:uncharacterized protein YbjT (DUF2867 family)